MAEADPLKGSQCRFESDRGYVETPPFPTPGPPHASEPGTVTEEAAFAATPEPPYTAVVFTSTRTAGDNGYGAMADAMGELAAQQPGYLGIESVRDGSGIGITVSYWRDESAARAWKDVAAHRIAQSRGRERWYEDYRVRIATVHRDYALASSNFTG